MGAPCFSTGETQACMRSSSACLGLILCAMCVVALVLLHDQPVEVNLEVKGTPSGLDGTPISLMSSKEMIAELSSTRAQNAQQHQLIQWYDEVMKQRKKLEKKQPEEERINYDQIRTNVDAAFNHWATKQHFAASAQAPQVDNNGHTMSMADIDAAYATYSARAAHHARVTTKPPRLKT